VGTIRDYEQLKRSPLLPTVQKLAKALKASLAVFDSGALARPSLSQRFTPMPGVRTCSAPFA
jgi:hypothetical protein